MRVSGCHAILRLARREAIHQFVLKTGNSAHFCSERVERVGED